MKKIMVPTISFLVFLFVAGIASAQPSDKAGCTDHAVFPTRMPDYVIESCKTEDFGAYDFQTVKGPKNRVEGKFTLITYSYARDRKTEPNGLAVIRNYENAIRKVGGTIVQRDPRDGRTANSSRTVRRRGLRPTKGTARSG